MLFYLNLVFAWIAMILAGLLTVIYFLRVLNKKRKINWVASFNRFLRKNHKSLGVILIIIGLAHGILSSDKAIGFNLGTFTWVTSILLGLSFVYRKRFKPRSLWLKAHRLLTVGFVALLVMHIVNVGGFVIDDVLKERIAYAAASVAQEETPEPAQTQTAVLVQDFPTPQQTSVITQTQSVQTPTPTPTATDTPQPEITSTYIDGIYQGTAEGFRPGLTVEVEILNDEIISVEVIAHNEQKEKYWKYPVENIPLWIVEAQSTDVDTVSGATYTSRGIIAAVDAALAKALNK